MGKDEKPWYTKELPRVDENISDPKIHKKAFKVVHGYSSLKCKHPDSCRCLLGGSYDMTKMFICQHSVVQDGIWTRPWALRVPISAACLLASFFLYKRLTPVSEKHSQYHPNSW
eukprot:TRINITY_DN24509_c0_g1_i1.p1 TRINITY_DN24509_c0_g1~~TRINITY_DN24509_c0_g1_i1.p1  ORF type:complete len:114 (+),score=13.68 TRINITY_DN24509_c0_g1_i1:64-405(+)